MYRRAASAGDELTEDAQDGARYRAFFDAGLPITFLGEDHETKESLDAAIDAALSPSASKDGGEG